MKRLLKAIIYLVLFCSLFLFVNSQIIWVKAYPYIYKDVREIPLTEAALILGASVRSNGSLSPVLQDRVDQAIKLYEENKVEKILVTGDNGSTNYNEVSPVRNYLLQKGIPDEVIFLDHAGFDTYSSMYRARDIFLVKSVTIVTQSFHMPRAVFIARTLGLNAYGMKAGGDNYELRNYIRELFANIKAVIDLSLTREPKYLGEEIPLSET